MLSTADGETSVDVDKNRLLIAAQGGTAIPWFRKSFRNTTGCRSEPP